MQCKKSGYSENAARNSLLPVRSWFGIEACAKPVFFLQMLIGKVGHITRFFHDGRDLVEYGIANGYRVR